MKKELVAGIVLFALVVGFAVGYYFGYDIGFERDIRIDTKETFTQDMGNEIELSDLIVVENPRPNQVVKSPLIISGRARGYWFFEASAPVRILDDAGSILTEKYIEAKGEWMTEDFVDFEGEITFSTTGAKKGTLILQNDNPSGLSENRKELRIPISLEE